jgi:hypothetical protein
VTTLQSRCRPLRRRRERAGHDLRARILAAGERSLRAIAARLAREGDVSRKGVPFLAAQVGRMLAGVGKQPTAA